MSKNRNSYEVIRAELRQLFPKLWRYCMFLTRSSHAADDLAQAACLRALEKAELYKADTNFNGWVFRIAQRLWLNEIRAQSIRTGQGCSPIEEYDLADNNLDPEMNILGKDVLLAIEALPETQKLTVILVYVDGFSYKEAAEVLEIPVGTVMSRLAVARKAIATQFNDEQSQNGE